MFWHNLLKLCWDLSFGKRWPVVTSGQCLTKNFWTYLPTEPPPVSLNTVGLNLKSRTQWSHSGHRTQWSHMASDGNPRGNKKVYGHREEGRSERKEEKTDPTLRQSSAPPGNEVLKGCCFEATLKKDNRISSSGEVWSKWGELEDFWIRVFCRSSAPAWFENSLIRWKSLEGGLLGLFVHIVLILILSQCSWPKRSEDFSVSEPSF